MFYIIAHCTLFVNKLSTFSGFGVTFGMLSSRGMIFEYMVVISERRKAWEGKLAIKPKIAMREIAKGSTIKAAMLKAGYSPASARNSQVLKRTKTWQELMDKFLPDTLLQKVHKQGLHATQFIPRGIGKGETELVEVPDHSVRHKYLATAYKIKGKDTTGEDSSDRIGHVSINIIAPAALEQPKPVEYVDNGSTEPK